jgi:hypothetical protein
MITDVFSTEDTALYSTWRLENGGIVCLIIPGVGEIRMTLGKAEEISRDLARQAEYGRWHAMEQHHDESQKKLSI